MELSKILSPRLIEYPLNVETKEDVISVLIGRLYKEGKISKPEVAQKAVLDREKLMSTGVGRGVALPHGKYLDIDDVLISIGVSEKGIDFDAIDGQPVYIFILLLTPEQSPSKHLKLLSRLSRLLTNAECRREIIEAKSADGIANVFSKYDREE